MANLKLPLDITPITEGLRGISESLKVMRDSLTVLPDVAKSLGEIERLTKFMSDEVHTMRKGVDDLAVEVRSLSGSLEPLVPHIDLLVTGVEALEPRLEDLSLAIHPLRRATGKLGRRRAGNGDPAEVAEALEEIQSQTESGENVSQADGSADS